MIPRINGNIAVGQRYEHFIVQISKTKPPHKHPRYSLHTNEQPSTSQNLHNTMNTAAVLQLDLVLLYAYIVATVVNVNTAVLGPEPHCRLVEVLVAAAALEARRVAADRGARRVRAWNVVRI